MNKDEFMTVYKSYSSIEKMPESELKKVISNAMKVGMPAIRPIPYVGEIKHTVKYVYSELTASCPMTLIQDLYTVTIEFVPDKHIPELKSLKMYFLGYIGLPISHEHLHAKIYKEFKEAVKPQTLRVSLDVAVRGGIKTDITYIE